MLKIPFPDFLPTAWPLVHGVLEVKRQDEPVDPFRRLVAGGAVDGLHPVVHGPQSDAGGRAAALGKGRGLGVVLDDQLARSLVRQCQGQLELIGRGMLDEVGRDFLHDAVQFPGGSVGQLPKRYTPALPPYRSKKRKKSGLS